MRFMQTPGASVALTAALGAVVVLASGAATPAPPARPSSPGPVAGQHDHAAMVGAATGESGQAAFASLAEVVRALRADPTTDWSRVNLAALRAHLVDMDALVLRAVVYQEQLDDGLAMTVGGDEDVLGAARRMLPAHGQALEAEHGWRVEVTESADEAIRFAVRGVGEEDLHLVRALGFFGILTLGAHHDVHHLMIARGGDHAGSSEGH